MTSMSSGLRVATGRLVSYDILAVMEVMTYPNRETRVRSKLKTSCSHSTAAADWYVRTLIRSGRALSLADLSVSS